MRSPWRCKPSASLLISIAALIVAASGTAIAASRLVNGDKLIAKGSLSGNRLRKHSITALQVNSKRLSKVPRAAVADRAATAAFATSATSAMSATTAATAGIATNATALGGQLPSAFVSSSDVIRTGLVTAAAGQTVTVASFAPFTMTLVCSTNGATDFAEIDATSTEAGAVAAQVSLPPNAPMRLVSDSSPTGTLADDDGNVFEFLAPSGKSYEALLAFGVNFAGHDCFANALIARS